jgi:hypothetical protein
MLQQVIKWAKLHILTRIILPACKHINIYKAVMPFINNLTNLFISLSPLHFRCNSSANHRALHHNAQHQTHYGATYKIQALSQFILTPFTCWNVKLKRTESGLQASMSVAGVLLFNVSIACRYEQFRGQVTMVRQLHSFCKTAGAKATILSSFLLNSNALKQVA